jgi:hypothetical protein
VYILALIGTNPGKLEGRWSERVAYGSCVEHDPLGISGAILNTDPQSGFASGEIVRTMTAEEQAAKLRLVGQVGRRVWE